MSKSKEGEIYETQWQGWPKGLDTLFPSNKIRSDELSQADNVILIGQGSVTIRAGTNYYGNSGSESIHTLLGGYYKSDGTRQLAKIGNGLFKIFNTGTSNFDTKSGASFASTARAMKTTWNDIMYISNGVDALTKWDGLGLTRFTAISKPTGLSLARGASLTSGGNTISYRISAINSTGETDATTNVTIQVNKRRDDWNPDPTSPTANYSISLSWTPSASSTGYNIYGVDQGFETYLDRVDGQAANSYIDYGTQIPSSFFAYPTANTTDAPRGNIINNYKSSILITGDPSNPNRLYYSAGVDKPEDFSIGAGGGFVDINKSGEDGIITGIGMFQDSAIIFKERSIWKFDFTADAIPSLVNVNRELGAISSRSIVNVENDLFFAGKKTGGTVGLFALGNEPNFITLIRTNEISARVRPELQALIGSNYSAVEGTYTDNRFILTYIDGSSLTNNRAIVYDRERLGFTKWNSISIADVMTYFDPNKVQHTLYIDKTDNRVSELSSAFSNDKSLPINWSFGTKDEGGSTTPFQYKRFKWLKFNMQDVNGLNTITASIDGSMSNFSLNIQGTIDRTAFRALRFRVGHFRKTYYAGAATISSGTTSRRIPLHRLGNVSIGKSIKYTFSGSTLTSKLTLLDLSFEYKLRSKSYFPLSDVYQI